MFDYCLGIYEYSFNLFDQIANEISKHFLIEKIIDYELHKNDCESYISIIYYYDTYCNSKSISIKKENILKYYKDHNTDKIKVKYILFSCSDQEKINTSNNSYIVELKKKLRQYIVKQNGTDKYLSIHITDMKKDSLFLGNFIKKITTLYKSVEDDQIIEKKRLLDDVTLFTEYNLVINISKNNDHQQSAYLFGSNYKLKFKNLNKKKFFNYQYCLGEHNSLYKLLQCDQTVNFCKNKMNKISDVIGIYEINKNYMETFYKEINDQGFVTEKQKNKILYVSKNNILLILDNYNDIMTVEDYIFSSYEHKIIYGLKNNIQKCAIPFKNHLESYYNLRNMTIIKMFDKQFMLKSVYKKDWHRENYQKNIMLTWDNHYSIWITAIWNSFQHFGNTSYTKLNFRRKYGNIIHAIDYPEEYIYTVQSITQKSEIISLNIHNDDSQIQLDINQIINSNKSLLTINNPHVIHSNNRSIVTTDFNHVSKKILLDKNIINSEKYGLYDALGTKNCLQFNLINNENLFSKYCGIPFHGWDKSVEKIFKIYDFKFNIPFDIHFINKILFSMKELALNIHNNKIYHNDIQSYNICINQDVDITLIDYERYNFFKDKRRRYTYGSALNKLHGIIFSSPLYMYLCLKNKFIYSVFIDFEEFNDIKNKLKKYNFDYNIDEKNMIISYPIIYSFDKYIFSNYTNINLVFEHLKYLKSKKCIDNDKYNLKIIKSVNDSIELFPIMTQGNKYFR